MIITHRGNDLGPENSMKGLIGSLDNDLEGIEADVSSHFIRKSSLLTCVFLGMAER